MYRKIVVVLDGSAAAEAVLSHVRALAGKGAEIMLVHEAVKPNYGYLLSDAELSACLDEESGGEASTYLAAAARKLKGPGLQISTCVLPQQGRFSDVIARYAASVRADLIAMSAHGKAGFVGRLFGGPAERILHRTRIPVLLVHP
jgi:nucleotide-binding universal stress UspA family protein